MGAIPGGCAVLASHSRSQPLLQPGWSTSILPPGAAGQKSACAAFLGRCLVAAGGRLSPSRRMDTGLQLCPAWCQRCFGLTPLPAQPVLQPYKQVRLLRALLPEDGSTQALGAARGPGAGSSETGLCLERVPLAGGTQSMWPWPWVTSPGEVWLWWCCPALWTLGKSAAWGGGEWVAL